MEHNCYIDYSKKLLIGYANLPLRISSSCATKDLNKIPWKETAGELKILKTLRSK